MQFYAKFSQNLCINTELMIRRKVMSDELYYRGSGSYEATVKNQLSKIDNSNKMLRNSILDMEYGIRSDIRQSTYAIVASQQMLAQTFQHGFSSVNNTLSIGFDRLSSQMEDIEVSIGVMTDKICSKLDKIHNIANNPLLTQSRELYRRARVNFEKGYYEEALEDVKAAVEKNKTDFISWNLLGQIYLFGAGKFSNVINLDEAENAFFNAAKYIDADIGHSNEADKFASEIYYYLGYTRLAISNDMLAESKIDESNKKLVEAESASGKAWQISRSNILARYEQAKELHFLGKDGEALKIIEAVVRTKPTFALKASNDKNFESIWDKIDELIARMRDEVAEIASKKVREIASEAEGKIASLNDNLARLVIPSKEEFDKIKGYINIKSNKFFLTLDEDINDKRMDLDIKRKELDIKQNRLDMAIDEMEDYDDEMDDYDDEKEDYDDEKEDLKEDIITLKEDIKTFEEEIKTLEEEIKTLEEKQKLKEERKYISKEDFSMICADCQSALESELKKYERLESRDYLSALKIYEELNARDSSEHLAGKFMEPASRLYSKMCFLYSKLFKDAKQDFEKEIEEEKKEEKSNKVFVPVFAIMAIAALIPAAIFILNERVIIGFLILVASAFFGVIALGAAIRLTKGAARLFARMYVVAQTLFTVGLFVKGHWVLGLLAGIVALLGFLFWNGEKKEKTNPAE